jgi:hypothetical protein
VSEAPAAAIEGHARREDEGQVCGIRHILHVN